MIFLEQITCFEWSRDKLELTASEQKKIEKLNRGLKNDGYVYSSGRKYHTSSYVGVLQVGKKRIEILPKLFDPKKNLPDPNDTEGKKLCITARKNLFGMLSFAGLIPIHKSGITAYAQMDDFFEFIASVFLDELEEAIFAQVSREYIPEEDELGKLRGRLNMKKQMRKLPSSMHMFSCAYDEFSMNNPLNQAIRAALKKLKALCRHSENKKRASTFYDMLDEVEDKRISESHFQKIRLNRLNIHYQHIVSFCEILLLDRTYSLGAKETDFFGLVFDMNEVFERCIVRMLRNSLPPPYEFLYQPPLKLISESEENPERIRKMINPDIIMKKNDKFVSVIDAKYKLVQNAASDLYQMIAYGVASNSDTIILAYPELQDQGKFKFDGEDFEPFVPHIIFLDKIPGNGAPKDLRKVRIIPIEIPIIDKKGQFLKKIDKLKILELLKGI